MRGMDHAKRIADLIGRQTIARRVGVKYGAVSAAVTRGGFPASWHLIVKDLCAERSVDCPDEAFSFKEPTIDRGAA